MWLQRRVTLRALQVLNSITKAEAAGPVPHVFCVDDDADDRALLLQLAGSLDRPYRWRAFATGDQLIDALIDVLRGAPPPLACWIDVRMPGMSGFDVLRWIRCQSTLDCMPAIMLSSINDAFTLEEAQRVGAQCFVAKFPTRAELAEVLRVAEEFRAARTGGTPFALGCNLLLKNAAEAGRLARSAAP